MRVTINGESQSLNPPMTLADLVEARGLTGCRIAVEKNGEIVPRSHYNQALLADGDKLEIVVAVGGG